MIHNLPFVVAVVLIALGMYALLYKKNLIKIVMGLHIIASGVNLFLVSLAYRDNSVAPIFTSASSTQMVLPTPHALTLTSIVINVAVMALMLSLTILIYRHYKTVNADVVRRLRG